VADKGTEQATPLRKKKARERGDGVHSRELLSAMSMLCGMVMLGVLSNGFVSSFGRVYAESLRSATGVGEQGGEQLLNSAVR
jgi:flagellar biosynthesis protein FlhB